MGASCTLDIYVTRPSDGSLQKSMLFDDLVKLTGNDRKLAKEYYALGTDQEFLDTYGEQAKFDENGQITANSLIKLANINIEETKIIDRLNKEIGAGVMQYDTAIPILQKFNRSNRFNDDFMATLVPTEDGRYTLQVVKKNAANTDALNTVIMKQSLQNRILYNLRQHGVDVSFIEKDGRERGRYSTENALQTADGLWSLIRVARGENVTPTLAQEAGHFAVGALGRDPLVERLEEALTPEVMRSIVSEDDVTVLGKNPRREIMGRLVGNAILEDGNNRNPLYKLAKRIWNKAKKVFYNFVEDDVSLMVMNAKATAEQIAQGFMSPDFMGTVENALNYGETLFDADLSAQIKGFKEVTNSLKLMSEQMKNIFGAQNKVAYERFRNLAGDAEVGININTSTDMQVMDRIATVLEELEDLMVDYIPQLLTNVDVDDIKFMDHVPEYSKNLRAVHAFCDNIGRIETAIKTIARDRSVRMTVSEERNLVDMVNKLGQDVKRNLLNSRTGLIEKEYAVFLRYLQEFYGKDYVQRSARIVFNFKKREPGEPREPLLKKLNDEKIPLADVLSYLRNDIGIVNRFVTSMADNPDIVGQLVDKIAKHANKAADDATNYVWDELRKLEKYLVSGNMGVKDTRIFCETDDDGNITGNYLSKVKFWKWEEDYYDFLREERINFYVSVFQQSYDTTMDRRTQDEFDRKLAGLNDTQRRYKMRDFGKDIVNGWSSIQRTTAWDEFMKKRKKRFHEKYSEHVPVTDPVTGETLQDEDGNDIMMYIPKEYRRDGEGHIIEVVYHNDKWDEVMENPSIPQQIREKRLEFLNKLKSIKMGCDQHLPVNANRIYRMPMFRGTFIERMRNRMKEGEEGGSSFLGAVRDNTRENIINTFTINSDDYDYGTAQTYNTEDELEDNIFADLLAEQLDKIERVPFFGINKLRDRNTQRRRLINRYIHEVENGNTEHAEELKKLKRMNVNEVSTDLLQSMLAYASMAHTYAAMNGIVDVLEVGRSVLHQRDEASKSFRKRPESFAYGRFAAYMEKQVYGIGLTAPKWDVYGLARKLSQGLNALSSKIFLGGNVAGGIVNTGTGFIELFKESVAGEFWTTEEFRKAYKIYQKCGFDSIIHAGKEFKEDDVSLIIRHFNILGDIRERHRQWDTSNKTAMRIGNLMQGSTWAPYKTGEHFMQTMAYIIALMQGHVIDKDGNRMSLLDMYKQNIVTETVEGETVRRIRWQGSYGFEDDVVEDEHGNEHVIERPYYKDTTDETGMSAKDVSKNSISILQKIGRQLALPARTDLQTELTDEEKQFLISHDILAPVGSSTSSLYMINDEHGKSTGVMDTSKYEKLAAQLRKLNDESIWSQRDESDFMDRCREINNMMHGIYNRQDKVALQQNILGNMALTMRGYALGMAARRFSSDRYNIATNRDFEGSIVTVAKMLFSTLSFSGFFDDMGSDAEERKQLKRRAIKTTLGALIWPYRPRGNSNIKQKMMDLGWSETQFANLKRTHMDFLIITALAILKLLSAADVGAGEDEDIKKKIAELKERKKKGLFVREGAIEALQARKKELQEQKSQANGDIPMGLLHYFISRWLREQTAFNTPGGIHQEGNALLEWKPAGYSILADMVGLAWLGAGALVADKEDSRFFYQRNDKAGDRYDKYDAKIWQGILRYVPYYRSYKFVFRRPYEALKSYEYNFDR